MSDAFAITEVVAEVKAETLVGDGKKFKDVDALAKAKAESDAFIEKLKSENAQLRQEAERVQSIETEMSALKNEIAKVRDANTNQPREKTSPALSESDLKALIAQTITSQEVEKTTAQNIVEANNQLIRQLGSLEKAQEAVKTKAAELNVPVSMLKDVAAKSPSAFLKLVGVEAKTNEQPLSVGSSVNSIASNFQGGGGQPKEGTKEYFDAKYKDPKNGRYTKHYWDPKVQNEIFKAAKNGTYVMEG